MGDRYKLARAHLGFRLPVLQIKDGWLFDMDNQLLTLRLDLLFSYEKKKRLIRNMNTIDHLDTGAYNWWHI